jgi:hypothetical protein
MRFISRAAQNELSEERSYRRRPASRSLADEFFDGQLLSPEVLAHHWTLEGDVHQARRLGRTDNTRYFIGPQAAILRDDMRRLTWAATVEKDGLQLTNYDPRSGSEGGPAARRLASGPIWRYHIALDKYTGDVSATWIVRGAAGGELWHDGERVDTGARDVDFPFFKFSQVPVGLVQTEQPPYGLLGYKSRASGEIFVRRLRGGAWETEQVLVKQPTVGGISFGIVGDDVLARVDLLDGGRLVPALLKSTDAGCSFSEPEPVDLSDVDAAFSVRPGYQEPIVDKGGALHVPIGMASDTESLALNHVVDSDLLVEAIRVPGLLRKSELWVFPSTLGSGNTFGNGVSDGHGLIMGLATMDGYLYTSNSSAGGSHFPEPQLLNHEMPLIAEFTASECYSSGVTPNFVSMDYLYIEANAVGQPVSSDVYVETWDMPLPVPEARAIAEGNKVHVEILTDADLEPGKVTVNFDEPGITITDVEIHGLRSATVTTDSDELHGKALSLDVTTLFHRHYAAATIK